MVEATQLTAWTPLTLGQAENIGASPPSSPPPAGSPSGVVVPGMPGAGSGTTEQQPLTGAPGGATGAPAGGNPFGSMMWILLGGMVLLILMTNLGQRKERRKRAEMLAGIKKGDRIQTLGGIIGTVAEMHGDELVLRVDESSNTRIRFAKSAIGQVLREGPAPRREADAQLESKSQDQATPV